MYATSSELHGHKLAPEALVGQAIGAVMTTFPTVRINRIYPRRVCPRIVRISLPHHRMDILLECTLVLIVAFDTQALPIPM